ncbi:type II secretion system protein [Clostridium intestinale]|uniref:type II secretion system protein n=1 Tax=Clostridium intestinale TaxID=36845 RepID=UPI002DD62CA6|nr:type II secretion system protein [Clostridium intestinale]WRY49999.1 type II secretion system protein [Clostridium intestinale]
MKKKKGFTLIEMIASMAMLVLIFSVIASLMLLAIKTNVRNEKDLDSNSVSKAFVELVNSKKVDNILSMPDADKDNNILVDMSGNQYKITFDDVDDLNNLVNKLFSKATYGSFKDITSDFENISDDGKKYAIKIEVSEVKEDEVSTYKIDINSWNLNNINTSKINRKIYINYIKN